MLNCMMCDMFLKDIACAELVRSPETFQYNFTPMIVSSLLLSSDE